MSANRNSSLYIFLILLLLAGILLFIFRASVLSYFSGHIFGEENLVSEQVVSPSASAELDLEILNRTDLKSLSNKVLYFDFNVVGRPNPENNISTPNWSVVYRGNFNPFFKRNVEPDN